jgi:starvation-inducible DNA-binding protein
MPVKTDPKLHPTGISIPETDRESLVELLNQTLANLFDLKSQVKQAHWNVKGPQFYQLHELFDAMAGELEPMIDDVAERAVTLGGLALGTVRMAAAATDLKDFAPDTLAGMALVGELAQRYATVANLVRDAIEQSDNWGDADTADLLTGVSRDLDKRLWFLESHLNQG